MRPSSSPGKAAANALRCWGSPRAGFGDGRRHRETSSSSQLGTVCRAHRHRLVRRMRRASEGRVRGDSADGRPHPVGTQRLPNDLEELPERVLPLGWRSHDRRAGTCRKRRKGGPVCSLIPSGSRRARPAPAATASLDRSRRAVTAACPCHVPVVRPLPAPTGSGPSKRGVAFVGVAGGQLPWHVGNHDAALEQQPGLEPQRAVVV